MHVYRQGNFAVTVRAHCHCQLAFFGFLVTDVRPVCRPEKDVHLAFLAETPDSLATGGDHPHPCPETLERPGMLEKVEIGGVLCQGMKSLQK